MPPAESREAAVVPVRRDPLAARFDSQGGQIGIGDEVAFDARRVAKPCDEGTLTSISTIEPLHAVEQGGGVVQVNVGLYASSTEGGQAKLRAALRRLAPGQGLAQSVLKKRGKCGTSLSRKLLGLNNELLVEPNCSSHASKHISLTSICQGACGSNQGRLRSKRTPHPPAGRTGLSALSIRNASPCGLKPPSGDGSAGKDPARSVLHRTVRGSGW